MAVWRCTATCKRDGKVFDGLQKRQLALIGKPWQVEPRVKDDAKGTQDAETLTAILKGVAISTSLCSELLEAMLTGYAVSRGGVDGARWPGVPARVIKRAQRRFVYVQQDEDAPAMAAFADARGTC
jgi:phage gp29-like protein